jgi:hypothetical protein
MAARASARFGTVVRGLRLGAVWGRNVGSVPCGCGPEGAIVGECGEGAGRRPEGTSCGECGESASPRLRVVLSVVRVRAVLGVVSAMRIRVAEGGLC